MYGSLNHSMKNKQVNCNFFYNLDLAILIQKRSERYELRITRYKLAILRENVRTARYKLSIQTFSCNYKFISHNSDLFFLRIVNLHLVILTFTQKSEFTSHDLNFFLRILS